MKVHLRKRQLKPKGNSQKPRHSLYLDIYHRKGRRKREFLGITLESHDSKELRTEKLKLAEKIRAKRLMELVSERHGFSSKDKQRQDFLTYFAKQTNKRQGNTVTAWSNTLIHLRAYSDDRVLFTDIDRDWLDGFVDYLKEKLSLQSVSTYFSKVSCALNEAVKDKIIPYNPAKIVDPIRVPQSQREYLTIEEIKQIAQTPFQYDEIKKAFLFSCFTVLRYGDIATLKWSQIKETNFNGNGTSFAIHKRQGKTGVVNHIQLN